MLWPQSGDRPDGQTRRSRRHYRGTVDWRTWHAVDHAHIPHRWNGFPDVPTAGDQSQKRRSDSLQRFADRAGARRQLDGPEQEWINHRSWEGWTRTRTL